MTSVSGESAGASTFEELYRTSRADATRLAWLLTHDAAIAEDIAHDAYLGLYRVFDQVANPAAYLRRSVINGVYEQAKLAGSPRVYWQTHQTNSTAMQLYNKVAEHSGFVVYRKLL